MPNTIHLSDMIAPGDPPVTVMSAYHTTLNRHDHDFYELVYVTEGFCLHETGGEATLLMEGDIFILPPGVSHRYVGDRVTRIYNCLFSARALASAWEGLKALKGLDRLLSAGPYERTEHLHLTLERRKRVLRLIEGMNEERQSRPLGWDLRLTAGLQCLLIEYARAYDERGPEAGESAYSAYVAQALRIIDERWADSALTVRDIAQEVGVSADYLSRQFHRTMGIAAQEYLRRYRFARAVALLQTDRPIGEIAASAGFGSLSHFSREFKREMGLSPSQYRRNNMG